MGKSERLWGEMGKRKGLRAMPLAWWCQVSQDPGAGSEGGLILADDGFGIPGVEFVLIQVVYILE